MKVLVWGYEVLVRRRGNSRKPECCGAEVDDKEEEEEEGETFRIRANGGPE